jgi:hypothetical protein
MWEKIEQNIMIKFQKCIIHITMKMNYLTGALFCCPTSLTIKLMGMDSLMLHEMLPESTL